MFHKSCIIPWYDGNITSPTCPICRTNLSNFEPANRNQNTINLNLITEEERNRFPEFYQMVIEIAQEINEIGQQQNEIDQRINELLHNIE